MPRILRAFALIPALASCSQRASAPPEPASNRASAAIIGATPSGSADDATLSISIASGVDTRCSGVLVADNLVLTARHCVSNVSGAPVQCAPSGTPLSAGANILSEHAPSDLTFFVGNALHSTPDATGRQIITDGAAAICNHDLAYVLLDRPIAHATIARFAASAPSIGESLTFVGYGATEKGATVGRYRRAGVAISFMGPGISPDGAGGVGDAELTIGESSCAGDSGGAALSDATGALVGIVSRGSNGAPYDPAKDPPSTPCVSDGGYVATNFLTRVDRFDTLTTRAFQLAGTVPWIDGQPDPRLAKLGAPCTSSSDCASGLCVSIGGESRCSQPCSASTPCPLRYTCANAPSVCIAASADAGSPSPSQPHGGCAAARHDPPALARGPWLVALLSFLAFSARRTCRSRRPARASSPARAPSDLHRG